MSTVSSLPAQGSTPENIVREIRAWTGRRGLKQIDVARGIDMDPARYSRCINSQAEFRLSELYRIAKFLDVDIVVFHTPSLNPWPNGRPDGPDGDGPGGGGSRQSSLDRAAERHRRYQDDGSDNHRYAAA